MVGGKRKGGRLWGGIKSDEATQGDVEGAADDKYMKYVRVVGIGTGAGLGWGRKRTGQDRQSQSRPTNMYMKYLLGTWKWTDNLHSTQVTVS